MSQPTRAACAGRALPDRRQVLTTCLVSAAAVALSGCGARSPVAAEPDGDLRRVVAAIADEEHLVALGVAVARRFPSTRNIVTPALTAQRLHVRRLRDSLSDLDPQPAASRPQLPPEPTAALTLVSRRTASVRDARLADCRAATAGLLAELFACVAANLEMTVSALGGALLPAAVRTAEAAADVTPLQACLAAEHAAVYGYGVVGGALSAGVADTPDARAATASYAVHRARRDQLEAMIRSGGQEPVASAPGYDVPFQVVGAGPARRLARGIETRSSAVYAQATAAMTAGDRDFVSAGLLDCAVRALGWGAEPVAFPGLLTG